MRNSQRLDRASKTHQVEIRKSIFFLSVIFEQTNALRTILEIV